MEEVDSIIIDSLKSINCDIDEEINTLKDFTPELVFASFVHCLKIINPEIKISHKLPPSMSVRLKLATSIAEYIKDLGYRGDMGYQTILYCNEAEMRRVLMFLIERVPRDVSKSVVSKKEGYVPKLVKKIEERIQESLLRPWVPTDHLKYGVRETEKFFLRQSFGDSVPLKTEHLQAPKTQEEHSEALKNYWIYNLPNVAEQCKAQNIIPSLLFHDSDFTLHEHVLMSQNRTLSKLVQETRSEGAIKEIKDEHLEDKDNTFKTEQQQIGDEANDHVDPSESVIQEIKSYSNEHDTLQKQIKTMEVQLQQVQETVKKKEDVLKDLLGKIQLKRKTHTVLSKQENLQKLKKLVDTESERLVELANQWNQVQAPLLEEYRSLLNTRSSHELKLSEEQQKLKAIQEKNKLIMEEIREKEKLEQQFMKEYERINRNTNRSAYTKRIMEIIGNIKKQEEDIKKILNDTKEVQKDINNLNGQLERSFTLADELIFRDAKKDETARKAYKLLATLHQECGQIVQTVSDLGLMERESRNLQDQVDAELARETASKLERALYDLAEVKKENSLLAKQIKEQGMS